MNGFRLCANCLLGLAMVVTTATTVQGATFFTDSFDRPDSDDIDSSTAGISASFPLPSDVYTERAEEIFLGNPDPLDDPDGLHLENIEGNTLRLEDGPNMGIVSINHNFVEAIPGTKVLTASYDVAANLGTQNGPSFFTGIGFGATQAEADAAFYDHNAGGANPAGWKGHQNGTTVASGIADFFVAFERGDDTGPGGPDTLGRIAFWKNGERISFVGGKQVGGTLEVELTFDDFNAGSTVTANVNYGGEFIGTDTFTWDNTNANYIGIASRMNGEGWQLDNLSINLAAAPVPEPTSIALVIVALCGSGVATRRRRAC